MPIAHDNVGQPFGPHTYEVTPAAIERYADAIGDENPASRKGEASIAPPLFSIVPGWDAMAEAVASTVPGELLVRAVHLIQDMRFARPIRAGDTLSSVSEITGIVPGERGTSVVCHVTTDAAGDRIADFYATSYIRGHTGEEAAGKPAPAIGAERGGEPTGRVDQVVDADQAQRYAEASGDRNPIHLSEETALAVGLPGVILHGMCTLGMAAAAAVEYICQGDVARLKRFAGRFSKPVLPKQTVTTTFWRAPAGNGRQVFAFECETADGPVVRDGVAEIA